MRKARPGPKGKGCRRKDYAHAERKACKLRKLVEDIMPTQNTVADAPLECMFLAFEGLQPRTRLWIRPLSQSLGDWLVFAAPSTSPLALQPWPALSAMRNRGTSAKCLRMTLPSFTSHESN